MPPRTKNQRELSSQADNPDEDIPEWARSNGGGPSEETDQGRRPASDANADGGSDDGDQAEETVQGVVASATPALDNLLAWLLAEAVDDDQDSLSGLEAIVREALTAENPADVLRQRMSASASNWVGVPLLLTGYVIRHSDLEDSKGLPFYVSLQVTCGEPPEPRVINTSSTKVLAQVKRLSELDEWPVVVQIIETRKAKRGENAPLALVAVA